MPVDSQEVLLYGAAAALRLLLFTVFPGLPNLLAGRVEVSTPVTSFKRCMSHPLPFETRDMQYSSILTFLQYKRASFSTPTTSPPTTVGSTTKHPSCCHSSRCCRTRHTIRSLPTLSSPWWTFSAHMHWLRLRKAGAQLSLGCSRRRGRS
jgi:hypothetical protein